MIGLYDRSMRLLRHVYDRRLSEPPIFDADLRFAGHRQFLAHWVAIRDEALALAGRLDTVPRFHELMAAQAEISDRDGRAWRMFVLKAYGVTIPANLKRCPSLARLLAASPDVLSAAISFLAPHKHIPEHRGPFRGVMRFYLALSVPLDACGRPVTELVIDGQCWRIADGECLLWDDTFPHEVRHPSPLPRIALLLDVRRRDLPADLALLSRLLIGMAGAAVWVQRWLPGDPFAARVGQADATGSQKT